jgi:hypothetical protein
MTVYFGCDKTNGTGGEFLNKSGDTTPRDCHPLVPLNAMHNAHYEPNSRYVKHFRK